MPGLLLFLGLGMAIGSDGTGWIEFNDYDLARTVGVVALALILFEGGLTSGVIEIRPVLGTSVSLALIATPVTAAISGLTAVLLFDFDLKEGLLVGAVLASTDGAAIFALLRNSTLRRRLARTLEGESGLNDPVAVLLVIALIESIMHPGYGLDDVALLLVQQLGIGLVVGLGVGWLAVQGFRRAQLATAGLYPVASLATAALAFGGADALHGSGFLAVYLAGLMLGSGTIPAQQTIASFHQGLAWVAQLGMFLTLGLLVFPSSCRDIAVEGTVLAIVAAVVARPLAVIPATLFSHFSWPRTRHARLGGPARGGAGGARDLPGHRRRPARARSSSTSSSSPSWSRRSPRARRSSRWRGASGSRPPSPRCRGRSPRAARSAASARRSSSTRWPATTRSWASACATSACRATPWST